MCDEQQVPVVIEPSSYRRHIKMASVLAGFLPDQDLSLTVLVMKGQRLSFTCWTLHTFKLGKCLEISQIVISSFISSFFRTLSTVFTVRDFDISFVAVEITRRPEFLAIHLQCEFYGDFETLLTILAFVPISRLTRPCIFQLQGSAMRMSKCASTGS